MDSELFPGFTVRHALIALVALVLVGSVLRRLFKPKVAAPQHMIQKRCPACGWSGTVSKFNQKCPKCAKPIA